MTDSASGETHASVAGAFEGQVLRTPDATAVVFDAESLSYEELNRRASALARLLVESGIGPGAPIGVCLDPGPCLAVAILGALKAGATYVPLSPADPIQRVAYQLEDTGAECLLTESLHAEALRGLCSTTILVDDVLDSGEETTEPFAHVPVDPSVSAYILYTSGSTGRPKGVAVSRRSLAYYLRWHREHLYLDAGKLDLPLSSSVCFAAGVTQFYTPLLLGRTLHILPRDTVRNPEALFAWFEGHPDFGLYCAPTLWNELVRYADSTAEPEVGVTPPRAVLLSGEAATAALVERCFETFPQTRLWNLYGPTETTANCTFSELRPGAPVTIGKPIAGTRILLLDEALRRVEPGEAGEICVCGDGVANGYVNLPDATAERFVINPYESENGRRLFRTGDLARLNADGDLVFIGRQDNQVQIRGHRVECGEIEAALQEHPAVRQAVVVARLQDGLGRSLVAYVTFRFARYASVEELRSFLAERTPDYMIPGAFVHLDAFPQLANGKVDRTRLPEPGLSRPALGYDFVAPSDMRERQLVRIWEESLGLEGVGAEDDFFDLGGDSLGAAAAILRIGERLDASVSYAEFFAHPTPVAMGALLAGRPVVEPSQPPPSEPVPLKVRTAGEGYAMAPNQRALWLLDQTYPGLTAYNVQFTIRFTGELDLRAVEESVAAVVRRHEVLRTVVVVEDGRPATRVRDFGAPTIAFHDLAGGTGSAPHREVEVASEADRLTSEASRTPFDLQAGPLYRFGLLRTGQEEHRLLVTVHHLVFDGMSINVFSRELAHQYHRIREGRDPVEDGSALQYGDWSASWESAGSHGEGALHWREDLGDSGLVLDLPIDFERPPIQRFQGGVRTVHLSQAFKERLTGFSRDEDVTPYMSLVAVFAFLLHRYSGQDEILLGSPMANRSHSQAGGLIGFFANTVVLSTKPAPDESFRELLGQVRQTCLDAYEHQSFPFEKLVELLGPERRPNRTPVFQAMFGFHEAPVAMRVDDGLVMSVYENGNGGAKYDLTLDAHDLAEGMDLRLTYRADLFAEATMERMLERLVAFIEDVMEDPARDLAGYVLSSASERRLVGEWNQTAKKNEREMGLVRLFEEQAKRTPGAIALVAGNTRLTYRELDARAGAVARSLAASGVGKGDGVGLHLDASGEMVIVLLGVLKAGAAYVPLDPYYPRERIDYIAGDAGLSRIITTRALGARDWTSTPCSYVEDLPVTDAAGPEPVPGVAVSPDDLMYLMYTSGSSGTPKGVRLPHLGPCNYVLWMRDTFPLTSDDAVLLRTSINFDISVWELFLPLITGARLVVGLRHELQAPEALAALIRRERVTQVQFVPSALRAFVDAGVLSSCTSLTRIFSGGEVLPRSLQNEVWDAYSGELHNLYGPTEASIYACHWACRRDDRYRSVPIGRPIDNTRAHILDQDGHEVPIGLPGELHIGGDCVAEGYHGKPEQTAAAFVGDPFSSDPAARLFKTGDTVRYLPGGDIEFLGRSDRQVKVRGYRIELGEIEHHLANHPRVKHAIIIVREDEDDDVRLVAYLLYDDEKGPSEGEFRAYLQQKLPDYMIPSNFVTLDSIPLLPNSKADVSKLPRPEYQKKVDSELDRFYANDYERILAGVWEDVLETSRFGPEDNFFDVGGHSLLMAKLGIRIEERLRLTVSNIDLFQYPTIRSLARFLSESGETELRVASDMARRAAMRNRQNPMAGTRARRNEE